MEFVIGTLVSAGLLFVMGRVINGVEVRGAAPAIVGALVLGLVNWAIWTLGAVLALPLTVLTLGLFALVLNAFALMLTARVVRGFEVRSFGAALLGSVALAVMHFLVRLIF